MRLHQRVGRLNRYGQGYAVDVVTVRNPDTVEARIWAKLNEKLEHITRALGSVMEEPEDLLQLVLGMAAPNLFDEVFSEAGTVERERLSEWFDEKTHTFGGRSAIETVRALVGNAARFDYQGIDEIPKADLPDLQSFFENALRLNRRRPIRKDGRLSFRTLMRGWSIAVCDGSTQTSSSPAGPGRERGRNRSWASATVLSTKP